MKKVTEFIMKILKPLIDEYKIRKREDAELNDAVLKEIERIKEKRKNKNKNIFRNNAFFDSIASKMEDANDERTIRNFETRQKKELETVRKYREKNYIWSILSLIGILLLILAIIITIAAVCENSKIEKDNNPSTIEINSLEKEGETKEKLNSQPDIKTDTLSENVDKAGNLLENDIEVLEQMAAIAAMETTGVAAMAPKKLDVVNAISRRSVLKPVHAELKNGAININLYIAIVKTAKAKEVAEAVQAGVKEKIQSMTGNAVTKVNVYVMDAIEEPEEE